MVGVRERKVNSWSREVSGQYGEIPPLFFLFCLLARNSDLPFIVTAADPTILDGLSANRKLSRNGVRRDQWRSSRRGLLGRLVAFHLMLRFRRNFVAGGSGLQRISLFSDW